MRIIRLRINDRIYKQFMWLLKRFDTNEIQDVREDEDYVSVQEYLSGELERLEAGEADFIDLHQFEQEMEKTIRKREC